MTGEARGWSPLGTIRHYAGQRFATSMLSCIGWATYISDAWTKRPSTPVPIVLSHSASGLRSAEQESAVARRRATWAHLGHIFDTATIG